MTRGTAVLALVLAAAGSARAVDGKGGLAAASELGLPSSALAAATGELGAGWVEDASAAELNPARLGTAGASGAEASQAFWPGGLTDTSVAVHDRLAGLGALALMARVIRTETARSVEAPDGSYGGDSGSFLYQSSVVTAGLSPDLSDLTPDLGFAARAGFSGSLVSRGVDGATRTGGYGGIGVEADPAADLTVRATLRRMGTLAGEPLPAEGAVGLTWRPREVLSVDDRLTVSGEAALGREEGFGGGVGVEYTLGWDEVEVSVLAGWRAAVAPSISLLPTGGLAFRVGAMRVALGAASVGTLGTAEVLTLAWRRADAEAAPVR